VDFAGKSNSPVEVKKSIDDEFYRGVVINYAQSKKWLKRHVKDLKRAKTSFQNENYYKISIRQEGIYQISGSDLSNAGINIDSIKPEAIRIYNNGGRELPRSLSALRPDSLIENAIRVVDLNSNGRFENTDYILFYGKAVDNWEPLESSIDFYQHYINHYTRENTYFLTWDNNSIGKRMENKVSASFPGLNPATDFIGLYYDEDELTNFLNSGLHWFGRLIVGISEQVYSVYLPHPYNQENNIFFRFRCVGITSGTHNFSIYLNNQLLTNFSFSGSNYLKTHEVRNTISLSENGFNNLNIKYNGTSSESKVYIDWFEIQYKKQFIAEDDYLIFNQTSDGPQKYQITNFQNDQIEVYDITDWSSVQFITNTEILSGNASFVDTVTGFPRRKYIALTPETFHKPEKIEPVIFADLRNSISGADFIIISHDDFYEAIIPLKHHREIYDSLKTAVVKISDIYNEFSWGLLDPIAIRDFVKFAFDNWSPSPRYVLLCGDGDYDYKNIKNNLDKNWIPPYETAELNENVNRTMDEFFVLVSGDDNNPDLAIGRFPVQTLEETENIVEKIIEYDRSPVWDPSQIHQLEDWRNIVTMVGDDEYHSSDSKNETMHTRDAEHIMENYIPNSFNKEKIYLIDYPAIKEPSTSGFRKPAATEALMKRVNNGTLILNFIGHGAPDIWADERVLLTSRDFDRIQNGFKLPLWIAATCDFGRFDDPMEQGLAEKLFAAKQRGGIAFMTSARLAYASDNTALNREFCEQLLKNDFGRSERLGVALIRAKINNFSGTNDQKYHLFGDPTMRLASPKYPAKITSIQPDTLKALSEMKITGQIMKQNSIWENFEGKALLKIFDSKNNKIYTTEFGSHIPYVAQGKTIFRGTIHVENGQFNARFIVPKDITYGGKLGRISIYFANEQVHGSGYQDYIPVGGTSVVQDTEGPIIDIGFEGQNFVVGGTVADKSILEVEIADSVSGVNIAGDIGHNITMVVDEQESNEIILTDLFNYFEGNFKAGKILYDFSTYNRLSYDQNNNLIEQYGLEAGEHTISIKAWDNFNNSSVATAYFNVVSDDILKITNVFNYPNPFTSSTTFTFNVSRDCKVKIKVYTIAGRLIETIDNLHVGAGMYQLYWNGRDRDGDVLANGVYLYKLIATAQLQDENLKDEYIGKLVVAR
ncbi:MAG: type IX secretion system sortase PorU, partial [bacterium]